MALLQVSFFVSTSLKVIKMTVCFRVNNITAHIHCIHTGLIIARRYTGVEIKGLKATKTAGSQTNIFALVCVSLKCCVPIEGQMQSTTHSKTYSYQGSRDDARLSSRIFVLLKHLQGKIEPSGSGQTQKSGAVSLDDSFCFCFFLHTSILSSL